MAEPFYSLQTLPLEHEATACLNGTVLARSTKAKIMFETRLSPVIYFPREDVIAETKAVEGLKTFCPFKGSASYWDIALGDNTIPSGAWSYETPLQESSEIRGHLSFSTASGIKVETGGQAPPTRNDGHISAAILDWLVREASFCASPEILTRALVEKLLAEGIAISRMSVMIWSLHPQIIGQNFIWKKGQDEISVSNPSYDLLDRPQFINSPLKHVSEGLGGVRQPLNNDVDQEFEFPVLKDLLAEGATDYVAMPLRFTTGKINVLTLTSDHPKGFNTSNLGLIFECSLLISKLYEVFTLQRTANTLLQTYLGHRTGERVMGGEIRRGDGEEINAAVMMCDLRNSTLLAETLPREQYLSLLNAFFDLATTIVNENNGEVLKFIGDAVLAVFPCDSSESEACSAALESSKAIVAQMGSIEISNGGAPLQCAIGLDFGSVTYGNVGSRERLDFTVIGNAANIAARLGELGKKLHQPLLASKRIASSIEAPMKPMGNFNLHNVTMPVDAFAPA